MEDSLISFTVYGEPIPWKRARAKTVTAKEDKNDKKKKSKIRFFEDSKVSDYKKKVIEAFEESGGRVYGKDVPLRMIVDIYMGVPKSASFKKQYDLIAHGRPTKRPDNDNLYKGIADALNGVAYYDDSQIVSTEINKFWSINPRVEVTIREVKT